MALTFFNLIKTPSPELLEVLNHNTIGTPGYGMRYQHLGVENKIDKIADPYFINLVRNNKIVGTCCFCNRQTLNSGKDLSSFYIRYFSFRNLFRRKYFSEKTGKGNSAIREEIKAVLNGNLLNKTINDQFFLYAYVDPRNIRSVMLCKEFGFETVRQYTSLIFNRIHPKQNPSVHLVSSGEENTIKSLLKNFYKDFNMFSFENLFHGRAYYVIKDNSGKILAGAQVNADTWRIDTLPGLSGKLILSTFSKIPILNRLFAKHYRFIAVDGIYVAAGFEDRLEHLLESLLATHKVYSAILCLDADTSLYKILKSLKLGWVDRLHKEVKGNVICKFNRFTEEEKTIFKSNPAYLSGIDVT